MFHLARNNLKFFLAIPLFIVSIFLIKNQNTFAVGNLQSPIDLINNDTLGYEGVIHKISFVLPYDSEMITYSDWIIIRMEHFTDIQAPTTITGNFAGTPEITVDNELHEVRITNISMLPGRSIIIDGLSANNPIINPDIVNQYIVQIIISEDEEGNLIKNIATVIATDSNYSVDVSATIAPPVASVKISGVTAPATFVTFMENGTVMGTDTGANLSGIFIKQLFGLEPGDHNISVYGVDSNYLTTSIINLALNAPIYQQTTVSNLLLSPTISINQAQLIPGENLIVSGSTIPSGSVNIFVESPLRIYYTDANAEGEWTYEIDDTDSYLPGDYRIYSLVNNNSGIQSIFSNAILFTVSSSTSGDPGEDPACDISQGDLNCDSAVDLMDFSILMYYWSSAAAVADINSDGIIDLIDFSILMYYWGS